MGGLKAVLFDAGNSLIHMPRRPEEILQELCSRWDPSISIEEAREAYGRSERYYVEHYLGFTGDQGEFWHSYHAEALRCLGIEDPTGDRATYLSHRFGRAGVWQAYPESVRVCRELRTRGLRLGVVSNGPTTVSDLLSQCDLLAFFEVVVASQSVGFEKPDPRIFDAALRKMGLRPNQVMFVGDLYDIDVLGARAAGLTAVLIDCRGEAIDRDCPVIGSLEQLIPLVERDII